MSIESPHKTDNNLCVCVTRLETNHWHCSVSPSPQEKRLHCENGIGVHESLRE